MIYRSCREDSKVAFLECGVLCFVQLVVLVLPSQDEAVCLDSEGQLALSILRQLGMPTVMAVLTGSASAGSAPAATKLKERAAAKKRVAAVLDAQVSHPSFAPTVNFIVALYKDFM